MVLAKVVPVAQAYRAVSWQTVVLVGALIPLSTAIRTSGAADQVASLLIDAVGDTQPYLLMAALFLLTATLGQVVSNTATVLVVVPIAVAAADATDTSATTLLMVVAIAGAAALLTLIATPANLMIMSPAGYRLRRLLEARPAHSRLVVRRGDHGGAAGLGAASLHVAVIWSQGGCLHIFGASKLHVEEKKSLTAYFNALLRGDQAKAEKHLGEMKSMSVGSDSSGGDPCHRRSARHDEDHARDSRRSSDSAREVEIEGDAFEEPIDRYDAGAEWSREIETRGETDSPQLGHFRCGAARIQAEPKVTENLSTAPRKYRRLVARQGRGEVRVHRDRRTVLQRQRRQEAARVPTSHDGRNGRRNADLGSVLLSTSRPASTARSRQLLRLSLNPADHLIDLESKL